MRKSTSRNKTPNPKALLRRRSTASKVGLTSFAAIFVIIGSYLIVASHADSLPAGVTLRQIDGGPNYYCSNGFTYACSSSFNGMSWDDPKFFPIIDDYSFYPSNSTATFKDLGLNTTDRVTSDTDMSVLRNAGIWAILDSLNTNYGPETVGWHIEEPGSWSSSGGITDQASVFAGKTAGRFFQPSFTWNQFNYGGVSGTPCGSTMAATMSCTSGMPGGNRLNIPSDDIYWFACSTTSFCQDYTGKITYGLSTNATSDQLARGSNYGDMVDQMRGWLTSPAQSAPNCPYIETEDGLVGTGSHEINPPEFNWAVWSTIVHGARCILYFGTTSNFGSVPTFGFSQSILPGQTISMYNQAKATNTLIKNLAPMNTPGVDGRRLRRSR